jgi:hypothetical protein
MYSGFNKLMIGFHILMAGVLVALLAAWVLGIWDVSATYAWLREGMVETWKTLASFGKALLQFF